MSLAQFPNFPRPSLTRSSPPIASPSQISTPSSTSSHRACCENGRPILTDPHTGQTVCSCQYPAGLMAYPRAALPPGLESVYNASAYAGYVALGTEGSAFYTPLGTAPYDLKESAEAWRTLAASQPGFPYDPMAVYPYGPGKNATRENTNTLKAWLYEHRKNPYPTKGEKIMLAIITKMTLTQVSTWFANARRRLKKENKMTWSPRNRSEDGSDDVDNQDDDDECADNRSREVISPSDQHELDITSSKPSSPLLSPGGHGMSGDANSNNANNNNNNSSRPFKERIIRVDEDEDGDDDDDDDDEDDDDDHREIDHVSRDAFGHRRHLDDLKDRPIPLSVRDRDRSPLRSSSDGDVRDHVICRVRPGHNEDDNNGRRPSSTSGEARHSPRSPASGTSASSPSHPLSRSPTPRASEKGPAPPQQATTRPKIWSISDFINTTSSSSTSSSTSSSSSISSSTSTSSSSYSSSTSSASITGSPSSSLSLSSPLSLTRPGFISPSSSASPHRSIPGQGFLFLPHGAAHWQAAAARFAGMSGAYPLSLAHTTLSYPYNLATPNAVRAGLEAHAQSVAQLARAAAESNAARGESSRDSEKLVLSGLARHPSGALFSPARDLDTVRPHDLKGARHILSRLDTSERHKL